MSIRGVISSTNEQAKRILTGGKKPNHASLRDFARYHGPEGVGFLWTEFRDLGMKRRR